MIKFLGFQLSPLALLILLGFGEEEEERDDEVFVRIFLSTGE